MGTFFFFFYHALGESLGRGKNEGMEIKKELVAWLNVRKRVPYIYTIDFDRLQKKVAKELGENGFYAEETHIKCAVECYKIRLCIVTDTLSNNEGCCSYTPYLGDIKGRGKVFHRGNTGAGDHYDNNPDYVTRRITGVLVETTAKTRFRPPERLKTAQFRL